MTTRKVGGEMAQSLATAEFFSDIPENQAASPKQIYAASGKLASLQELPTSKVWYAMFKTDRSSKTKVLTHGDVAKILSATTIDEIDKKYLTRFKTFTKDRQPSAVKSPAKKTQAAPTANAKIEAIESQIADLTKVVISLTETIKKIK